MTTTTRTTAARNPIAMMVAVKAAVAVGEGRAEGHRGVAKRRKAVIRRLSV
jgi:hypothetical protein